MNKFIKGAVICVGGVICGFVLCGVTILKIDTVRKAVVDKIADNWSCLLYGKPHNTTSKVSYRSCSTGKLIPEKDAIDDICLRTRKEAEEIITRISDIVKRHGSVSVADVYYLAGIVYGCDDNLYGWTSSKDINRAFVRKGKHGYTIDITKPKRLLKDERWVHHNGLQA